MNHASSSTITVPGVRHPIDAPSLPDIRVVALDFDLTIYDHADPHRTLELLPWLEQLSRRGVKAGLASGRRIAQLKEPLDAIGWPWGRVFPSFVICDEGEILTCEGADWIGAETWNRDRRRRVLEANALVGPIFQEILVRAEREGCRCLRPLSTGAAGANVVLENPGQAEQVRIWLQQRLRAHPELCVSRNHHIVLVLPANAGKGAALAELARIEQIQPAQLLAIGDNFNDESMLCDGRGFRAGIVGNGEPTLCRRVAAAGGFVARQRIVAGVQEIFARHFECVPTAG